jgi:hypothetical protein
MIDACISTRLRAWLRRSPVARVMRVSSFEEDALEEEVFQHQASTGSILRNGLFMD